MRCHLVRSSEALHYANAMSKHWDTICYAGGYALATLSLAAILGCSPKSNSDSAPSSPQQIERLSDNQPELQYNGHSFYYWYAQWADSTERSGAQARKAGD